MQYNLAQNSYIIANLTEGNKDLTYPQLVDLVVDNDATITLSGSDILSVEMDLGERVLADEIRYYFTSDTPSSTVVSGIYFYCKLGPAEIYSQIDSLIGATYYYATITGTSYAPRHVKLTHTISGTSISGTATALQIISNDDLVDFGEDGNRTGERFDLSLYYDQEDIKEVVVFNSSLVNADAYVTMEPQYGLVDSLLEFGPTASGPWYGPFEDENKVCGADRWANSYNYYNNTISFSGTYVYNNTVKLHYTATSGTYTTCVFGGPEYPTFVPLLLGTDYPTATSGLEFFEDFSTLLGTNWQVTYGTVVFSNGYLGLPSSSSSCDVYSINYLNFSEDWEVLMKIMWNTNSYSSSSPEERNNSYFPYYASGTEYVRLIVFCSTSLNSIRFYVNGTLIHTNSNYNAYNEAGNWFWLRTKRTRTSVKYKLWKDGASEPDWTYSYPITYTTFSYVSARIRFYSYVLNSPYANYRADNISLWTNCSAAGESNHLLAVDSTDTMETLQIKSTNAKPANYNVYTTYSGIVSGGVYYVKSVLRYFDNDVIRNEKTLYSASYGSYPFNGYGAISDIDYSDETVWSILMVTRPSQISYVFLCNWRQLNDSTLLTTVYSKSGSTINCDFRFMVPNKDQSCWIYFKTTEGVLNGAGYYLRYYNSSLTATFSLYEPQSDFVGGMCLANANGDLWYANKYLSTVLKINTSGSTLCSYDAIDEISKVHPDGNGGCYVLQGEVILRLDLSAQLLYTVPVGDSINDFCIDKDTNGFWLLYQFSQIINITSEGIVNFSTIYSDDHYVTDLRSVHGGVWFKCIDDKKWRFLDGAKKIVTKEIYTPTSGGVDLPGFTNTPMFFSKAFNEDDFDNRFPVPNDTHWQNLPWRKISPRNYLLPREQYHQIKFIFRASDPGGISPILNYLYRQHVIKLENIPSGQTKSLYVKANISSLNETQLGHYTSNLRTWWYIPE